ncbi:MAG: M15 family metallopeptidase [Clostridia bacterium]|nr:M15 family metallopeptidase [Clostridia bacterium]
MGEKKQLVPLLLAIVLLCGVLYAVHPDGLLSWLPDYLEQIEQPSVDAPTQDPADDPADPPSQPTTPINPPAIDPSDDPTDQPQQPTLNDPSISVTPKPDDPDKPTPDVPDKPQEPYQYSCDVSAYLSAISTTYDSILLVNKTHPLGEAYVPANLVTLDYNMTNKRKTVQLDATAAAALEAMWLCMRADGITDVFVTSGYRSYDYQEWLQAGYVAAERKKDPSLSTAEALELVRTYSAEPGKSEHQSGLCVDFITAGMDDLTNVFESYEVFTWLQENACQFGFILRYPKDKVNVTKYSYESWHYRFVGRDAAIAITESGLTLEEYLAQ